MNHPVSRRALLCAAASPLMGFDLSDSAAGPQVAQKYPLEVGLWYTVWWDGKDHPEQWNGVVQKLPVLGKYTARDPQIIAKHYEMMRDCGITFLIFDQTNTLFVNNGVLDQRVKAWYDFMDAKKPSARIPLCIAFGGELNQHHNKEGFYSAADYLFKTYANRPSQMKIEGKPLVLWYISEDVLSDWKDDRWTIKRAFHFLRTPDQAKWGGWGWGSHTLPPPNKECMSLKPGWHLRPASDWPRQGGAEYMRHWLRVLASKPRYVTICDWNNFFEETAIEDSLEWTDTYGTPTPDWYRQITKQYVTLLQTGGLTSGCCYKEEDSDKIWQSSVRQLTLQKAPPHGAPVILLPSGMLDSLPKRTASR